MLTLAETSPKELVAFRADTWEFARLIYTLVLTKVTRETALIYVCVKNKEDSRRWAKNICCLHYTEDLCMCCIVYFSPLQVNPSGPSS